MFFKVVWIGIMYFMYNVCIQYFSKFRIIYYIVDINFTEILHIWFLEDVRLNPNNTFIEPWIASWQFYVFIPREQTYKTSPYIPRIIHRKCEPYP